jgi:GNAT superfamily N-acetyltransferase
MGEPITEVFDCYDLVADLLTYYYIHFEPQSCFVAEEEGKVVGYILGAVDTRRSGKIMIRRVYPLILGRFILGRYKIGKRELAHGWRLLKATLRGELSTLKPDLVKYPAHLHINILKPYRRRGIGIKLMNRFLEYLKDCGVRGVHLATTNMHKEAVPFYERMGFQLLGRIETAMWRGIIQERVETLVFVKFLA